MSNGGRCSSASPATKKTSAAGACQSSHHGCQASAMPDERQRAGGDRDAARGQHQRQLVGEQLRGGAQPAEQGVLVRAGPARHQRAEHAHRADREHEEQAGVEVGADRGRDSGSAIIATRYGRSATAGREPEDRAVRGRRDDVLLLHELDAVGDELRPAVEAAGVHRAEPALHVRHHLVLGLADQQRQHEEGDDDDRRPQDDSTTRVAASGIARLLARLLDRGLERGLGWGLDAGGARVPGPLAGRPCRARGAGRVTSGDAGSLGGVPASRGPQTAGSGTPGGRVLAPRRGCVRVGLPRL